MNKTKTLVSLIKSMSKGEKRYLKMYGTLQKGDKDYLWIFDRIDNGTEIEEIKKQFLRNKTSASFDITCNYLYKIILEVMLHLRLEKSPKIKMSIALLKAEILFEKGLFDDGFKEINKIRSDAEASDANVVSLLTADIELKYFTDLNFRNITEDELIKKQTEIQQTLKNIQHHHQHKALCQILHHRSVYKGNVRTQNQKEELNDLVFTEMNLISKRFTNTSQSQKTHLLFQANYFMAVSDYMSALKIFTELVQVFEENDRVESASLSQYLIIMEGILESLNCANRYNEVRGFMEKLSNLKNLSDYQELTKQRILFTYEMIGCLSRGDFKNAHLVEVNYQQTLLNKIQLLDLSKQAEIYLYRALIRLGSGELEKAQALLNCILLEGKDYYALPIYRTFRLIRLLLHCELNNHDYINCEIRSIKRGMKEQDKMSYLTEKLIFRFVQSDKFIKQKEKLMFWNKIKTDVESLRSSKFEIQLLKLFDFCAWMESRLCKKSFSMLLNQKYLNDNYKIETERKIPAINLS